MVSTSFTGAFKGMATASQTKTFNVPPGTKAISLWLTWDDGTVSNALSVDVDLFLKTAKPEASAETTDYEYIFFDKAANLTAGGTTWTAEVLPYDVSVDITWSLTVFVWGKVPVKTEFTGNKAGANPGSPTGSGPAVPGTGSADHKVTVPSGSTAITVRLVWTNQVKTASSQAARASSDYDLVATAGGAQQTTSGNGGGATEFLWKIGAAATPLVSGEWTLTVTPFSVASGDYTLTALVD